MQSSDIRESVSKLRALLSEGSVPDEYDRLITLLQNISYYEKKGNKKKATSMVRSLQRKVDDLALRVGA